MPSRTRQQFVEEAVKISKIFVFSTFSTYSNKLIAGGCNYNFVNRLQCKCNYSATLNNMKFVHWPVMGGLLHLVQRGGD